MMKAVTTHCLLNHPLTQNQITELETVFNSGRIVYPPAGVSSAWGGIPAEKSLSAEHLRPFTQWLSAAHEGDCVVLQGEAGATFALVDFALSRGLVPLHSVTQRVARENRDGEKVFRSYVFEHICFRRYRYFDELS
jgi:hypothetical protein